uniref:Uncharacterized protein n=1 Tax=Tolypothrix bouteillei VB521301 TaxID=1479485 RepID=A0A0C1QQK7_9CYAN
MLRKNRQKVHSKKRYLLSQKVLRKRLQVNSPKGIGHVSGDTEKQVSVSDANWKRLGQIASSKIQLIRRSNGLIVA